MGTGTAGAYHAGVLRALLEAGVRLDIVAGRGMGAATALFAAVDAAPRLWDASGAWRGRPGPRGLYSWRLAWRIIGAGLLAATLLLALPLAALLLLAGLYPLLLLVELIVPSAGAAAVEVWRDAAAVVSGPAVVAGLIPRLVTAALLVAAGAVLCVYVLARYRYGIPRQGHGALWWRALGAPFDTARVVAWALAGFWQFLRGAAPIPQPEPRDLSRRYSELLTENLGQPGYRELILLAHDLDTRRDMVFALLAEPWRKQLLTRAAMEAAGEVVDLAGVGRVHVVDALAAALCPPIVGEPRLVSFAADSHWRGETHRLCDRPSSAIRLLREVAEAGATQVIVVSPTPAVSQPHALVRPGTSPRARIGEGIYSIETAALQDALDAPDARLQAVFPIQLAHNPVPAFAFAGSADERSDRQVAIDELVDRGYEDAYRQFLEPVIGASGEQIHGATVVGPTPRPGSIPPAMET